MQIIQLNQTHWYDVKKIYEQGIATKNATFQTAAPTWKEWDDSHLSHSRIVAQINNQIVGWAALSPVSERCVYNGVAEVSVYVDLKFTRLGIGKSLLLNLISESEANKIWTLQSGIFPENKASIHLHKSCGFKKIGIREKLGKMDLTWRDVILLERRSDVVGV